MSKVDVTSPGRMGEVGAGLAPNGPERGLPACGERTVEQELANMSKREEVRGLLTLSVDELCLLGAGLRRLQQDGAVAELACKVEGVWAEAFHASCAKRAERMEVVKCHGSR